MNYERGVFLVNMAKPIRATPELKGVLADRFLQRMIRTESSKMTRKDRLLAKEIQKNSDFFIVH